MSASIRAESSLLQERALPEGKFRELCRLRSELEAFAVVRLRKSGERAAIFEGLRVQMQRLRGAAATGSYQKFHAEDMAWHRRVIEAAGLESLTRCWDVVAEELDPWILAIKKKHWPSLLALYREHEYLLDAWDAGSEEAAKSAAHLHLEAGWYRLAMAHGMLPEEGSAVDRAASFLATHYASRVDIAWMAENICFVSVGHLTKLFGAQFGKPPYAWLRQIRMERAAELLLQRDDAISSVARGVGYGNTSHFVRDFRVHHGTTPARFRQERM